MDKNIPSSISIEKFAAYLDGNLMPDEMEIISSKVNDDEMMQDILSASKQVEETIEGYTSDDLILPEELNSDNFEIPSLVEESFPYIASGNYDVAACAALDVDDFGNIVEDEITSGVSDTEENQISDNSNDSFITDTNITVSDNDSDLISDPNDN